METVLLQQELDRIGVRALLHTRDLVTHVNQIVMLITFFLELQCATLPDVYSERGALIHLHLMNIIIPFVGHNDVYKYTWFNLTIEEIVGVLVIQVLLP